MAAVGTAHSLSLSASAAPAAETLGQSELHLDANGHTGATTATATSTSISQANGLATSRNANGHAAGPTPDPAPAARSQTRIPAYTPYRPQLQDPSLLPGGRHPLSGISVRAFCLGIALGTSTLATILLAASGSELWRPPCFLACLSIFHFLEFWTHAAYNTPLATISAFLLDANGSAYKVAHLSAFAETTLMHSVLHYPDILPTWVSRAWLLFGLGCLLVGQSMRSLAMIHCGRNFNHTVQTYRKAEHELVTHGVYSILRHPSYFGFFWWAIGTQVVLGNWFCLAAYVVVLWNFFAKRIKKEEQYLTAFFGKQYEEYKAKTGVLIPGIS